MVPTLIFTGFEEERDRKYCTNSGGTQEYAGKAEVTVVKGTSDVFTRTDEGLQE